MTSKADKNRRTSYTLAAARRKVEETVGGDNIEIFVEEGGEPFYLPHPYFYDNATKRALKDADDEDDSAQARILLGDDQYERFIAAGGSDEGLNLVMIAVGQDLKDAQGN